MNTKQRDIICSIAFIIFGMVLYVAALSVNSVIANDVGPAFMPKVIGVFIAVLAALKLVLSIMSKGNKAKATNEDIKAGVFTIIALLAYVLLFNPLGFIVSTALYLFAQFMILSTENNRNIKQFTILSIVTPLIIYFLFVYGFKLILPSGILGFI